MNQNLVQTNLFAIRRQCKCSENLLNRGYYITPDTLRLSPYLALPKLYLAFTRTSFGFKDSTLLLTISHALRKSVVKVEATNFLNEVIFEVSLILLNWCVEQVLQGFAV